MAYTPETFAAAVLRRLNKPVTPANVKALVGWQRAEGGHWHNSARYNPLNTTQPEPGAGNTGTQGNIKVYRSAQQGIDATVRTLKNGRYGGILNAFSQGNNPNAVAQAIGNSPWGTSAALISKVIGGTPTPKNVNKLMDAYGATKATPVGTTYGTPSVAAPPTGTPQDKGKLLFSYLQGGQGNIANVFAQLGKTSAPTPTATPAPASAMKAPAVGDVKAIFERAAAVNAQHLPYQWGGGHGPTPAKPGVPLDCSGAVSKVLNVSPRVSGQFTTFGAPGKGKNVTIYANGHHVLMEIQGHLWGTSASNPGGGAGWIPRSAISPGYLKGFVARHPPGL